MTTRDRGATAVEYGLLLAACAILLTGLIGLRATIRATFDHVADRPLIEQTITPSPWPDPLPDEDPPPVGPECRTWYWWHYVPCD